MTDFKILYLYPDDMNFYGDTGNVIALKRRLEWLGFQVTVLSHNVGDTFSYDADIIVGGGGQDSGQLKILQDLQSHGSQIRQLADQGVPMLMVCGLYQLFGHRFVTSSNHELKGIGVFQAETIAKSSRLIGDIAVRTDQGIIVGYENHSGQTMLAPGQPALGSVIKGYGNNAERQDEGAIYNNVYGTYMHGSLLPKNPALADTILKVAMDRRNITGDFSALDNTVADMTRTTLFRKMGIQSEQISK